MVTGLQPRQEYHLRIVSINKYGFTVGPQIRMQMKGSPNQIESIYVVSRTRNSFTLSWYKPELPGGVYVLNDEGKSTKSKPSFILKQDPEDENNPETKMTYNIEHDNASNGQEWVSPGCQTVYDPSTQLSSAVISRMDSGKCYQIRITASNIYGISAPSKPIYDTPTKDRPTLYAATSQEFFVGWDEYIFENLEAVVSYEVQFKKDIGTVDWVDLGKKITANKRSKAANNSFTNNVVSRELEFEYNAKISGTKALEIEPETTYAVRIMATDKRQKSYFSLVGLVTTLKDGTPPTPRCVTVDEITKTSFRTSWEAAPKKFAVINYILECDNGTRGILWSLASEARFYEKNKFLQPVPNLEAGKTYQVRLMYQNDAGNSSPSNATIVTTQLEDGKSSKKGKSLLKR